MRELPKMHVMTASGFDPRRDAIAQSFAMHYGGEVQVHDDAHRQGILFNHLEIVRAMAADPNPTGWALVVQDDIRLLPYWEDHLREVMITAPAPYVSLSHFSQYGRKIAESRKPAPYGLGANVIWGQAVLYRADVLPRYLELVEDVAAMNYAKYRKWDDGLIAVDCILNDEKACFTTRALVEHQPWASTVGNVPGVWRHASLTIEEPAVIGGAWHDVPASRSGGLSISPIQREAAAEVLAYRKDRS